MSDETGAHLTAAAPRWVGLRVRVQSEARTTTPVMLWQCARCRFGTTTESLAVEHAQTFRHQLYAHEVPDYDAMLGRAVCHPKDATVVTRILRFMRGIGDAWLN